MLQFRIQSTPNPNARKYVLNEEIKAEGKVSFRDPKECEHVPLAFALMSLPGVSQLHFFENVLTVTQDGSMDWAKLDHGVQTLVSEKIKEHDIYFETSKHQSKTQLRENLSPELQQIDQILDETIRPGLQMDGGDIELIELEGQILTVRYMGACGSCPSSMTGTLEAIKMILRERFHPELEVVTI